MLKVSTRTIRRWFDEWDTACENIGKPKPARRKRGRKPKLSREEFEAKLLPLIHTASGEVAPVWSLAEVQRQAKKKLGMNIGYSALRRYFRKFGMRPRRAVKVKAPPDRSRPWAPEYGESMADFLRTQDAHGRPLMPAKTPPGISGTEA